MDVFIVHQIENSGGAPESYILGVTSTLEKAEQIRDFYKFTWEQADMAWDAEWVIEAWNVDGFEHTAEGKGA